MVGVEQGPYVTGKLVQLGQPHALLATNAGGVPGFAVVDLFVVQLRKAKDETFSSAPAWECIGSKTGRQNGLLLTSTR